MSDKTTKHENFKRVADLRARKLQKSLQVLSNLASLNYEFYPDEIDTLFNFIEEQISKARSKFDARLQKAATRANKDFLKTMGIDGDLGEEATPASPETSLPGPSERDIEHENDITPGDEAPWSNDEPAGPEMEMEMAIADGGRVVYRPR